MDHEHALRPMRIFAPLRTCALRSLFQTRSAARVLALGDDPMEPHPMVAKPSRRRRRATTGDLSAVFEDAQIGSHEAVDASADAEPRRQLSKAGPGPRRTASLGPSQFAEASKPRIRRATTESFGATKNNFGAADSPRRSMSCAAPLSRSLSQNGMGANGDPPKRSSSRRSSNDRAPSQELRRSNSFDSGEGRRSKKKSREKLGAVEEEEEEVVAMKPSGGRPRRRRATTGDLACNGAAHDAAGGNNGDDVGRDNETAKMQAVISALQVSPSPSLSSSPSSSSRPSPSSKTSPNPYPIRCRVRPRRCLASVSLCGAASRRRSG